MIDCVKTVDTILFFICPCLPQRQGSPQKLQISLIFVSYIYYIFYSCDNSPPFKTFTPPNMYMFLTPPIRRCFFRVFIFRRSDHRSPVAYFSIATPQSALPTAPLNGSLANCLSLRRGGTQCRSGGSYLFSIIFSLLSIISFVRAVIGRPFDLYILICYNYI